MTTSMYFFLLLFALASSGITAYVVRQRINKDIENFNSLKDAIIKTETEIANKKDYLLSVQSDIKIGEEKISSQNNLLLRLKDELNMAENNLVVVKNETVQLQELRDRELAMQQSLNSAQLAVEEQTAHLKHLEVDIDYMMKKADLYSRIDEFVDYGHFEMPKYLYETSTRFAEEIKIIREQQREMISMKTALVCPKQNIISEFTMLDDSILKNHVSMMLKTFNIECDFLISGVNPGNFARTIERIGKTAGDLEKMSLTLECGFSEKYVSLKFEECRLQYQYKLKKQEEQEEQRIIREQMREEQKAIQEAEKAMQEAEKEERLYRELIEKAKKELADANDEQRRHTEVKIAELEYKLAEAERKELRAKSMAEQTRKGHVYIISNIGSFGENVYKIGMTRRLEPMDRVRELGDASVPFTFDVHAMIASEDAPKLESELHKRFALNRLNAVNFRKEFFRINIENVKEAVEEITNNKADFVTTILAEEYYESKRLQSMYVVPPSSLCEMDDRLTSNT